MRNKYIEMTRRDILSSASPEPWKHDMHDRIQGYKVEFTGVYLNEFKNLCVVTFRASAFGHTTQYAKINLDNFWEMYNKYASEMSLVDIVRLVIQAGDLHIFCTCPAWVYGGYEYIATQLDYALFKQEHRFPKIRNPRVLGSACKHLYLAINYLPNNVSLIAKDIKSKLGG